MHIGVGQGGKAHGRATDLVPCLWGNVHSTKTKIHFSDMKDCST